MKTQKKIFYALSCAALLMAVVQMAFLFRAFDHMADAASSSKHSTDQISGAESLLSELKDAETGQRGYLLTGDKAYLKLYC